MYTCFLFADTLDEEHCLSISLNEDGSEQAPLMHRTVDELRSLQENARTIVILPTRLSGLYEVELPWLSYQKARAAIPFALEEQLAEPVNMLHFAYDRAHYQQHHYLVVVIEKKIVFDLMSTLEKLQIKFDAITLDWFALALGEAAIIENNVLVNDPTFKGALSIELMDCYLKNQTQYSHILTFKDNPSSNQQFTLIDKRAREWVAARLLTQGFINICQGELQHNTQQQQTTRWYHIAAALGGLSVLGVLVMNLIMLWMLKGHLADYEAKIATLYHQFFKTSQQVISPRFRVTQLLAQHPSGESPLWPLLTIFTDVTLGSSAGQISHQVTIQQLRFQNNVLSVTLACPDFASLEQIESHLQTQQVKVHQANAAKEGKQVIATLELSL